MEYIIILGVGIVCTIVGLGAGYMLGNSRDDKTSEDQPETLPEVQLKPSQPQYPADALHIWRDNTNKQLVLQIGERVIQSMEPFTPTEQKYMQQLLAYLQHWLGIPATTPPAPQHPAQPAPQVQQTTNTGQPHVSPFEPDTKETPENAILKKSIVAQIDDILQEKVLNSPLKDRGVRLMESVDGSMSVYIGFDRYIDIDSIPDEDVIAIIRASVKEWEQRQ